MMVPLALDTQEQPDLVLVAVSSEAGTQSCPILLNAAVAEKIRHQPSKLNYVGANPTGSAYLNA